MSDELKERNILKLILMVRFTCATLDMGHPIHYFDLVNKFTAYLNAWHLTFTEFKGEWSFVIGLLLTNVPPEVLFGRSPTCRRHAVDFDADSHLIQPPIHAPISIGGIHPVHSTEIMDKICPAKAGFD
jgi:hypothetical protein